MISPIKKTNKGLTLVEMLVVIAIIGILAAVLVPVVSSAIQTANEAAISIEMKSMETAIEQYKNKVGSYPTDFGNPLALRPHVIKLSSRAAFTNRLIDLTSIDTTTASIDFSSVENGGNDLWYTATLTNPHAARGASTVTSRSPITIDPSEALVFWMYETTTDPRFPLGAINYDDGNGWVVDAAWWAQVWDPNRFREFDEKQFSDVDGDGWFEFRTKRGPQNVPMVYFDSRTYANLHPSIRRHAMYPSSPDPIQWFDTDLDTSATWQACISPDFGVAQPYWDSTTTLYEPNKYQIVHAGIDGDFGYFNLDANDDVTTRRPYDVAATSPAEIKVVPLQVQIRRPDRDNLTSFTDGRIDTAFVDE